MQALPPEAEPTPKPASPAKTGPLEGEAAPANRLPPHFLLIGLLLLLLGYRYGSTSSSATRPLEIPLRSSPVAVAQSPIPALQNGDTPGTAGTFASPVAPVADLEKLTRKTPAPPAAPTPTTSAYGKKPTPPPASVDVNTASQEQLMSLPGVGLVLAQRIIDGRKQGKYATAEDLRRVSGLGAKKIEAMAPYLKW